MRTVPVAHLSSLVFCVVFLFVLVRHATTTVISAYGTVGLTLGFSGLPSFTSSLLWGSKVFIAIIMLQVRPLL